MSNTVCCTPTKAETSTQLLQGQETSLSNSETPLKNVVKSPNLNPTLVNEHDIANVHGPPTPPASFGSTRGNTLLCTPQKRGLKQTQQSQRAARFTPELRDGDRTIGTLHLVSGTDLTPQRKKGRLHADKCLVERSGDPDPFSQKVLDTFFLKRSSAPIVQCSTSIRRLLGNEAKPELSSIKQPAIQDDLVPTSSKPMQHPHTKASSGSSMSFVAAVMAAHKRDRLFVELRIQATASSVGAEALLAWSLNDLKRYCVERQWITACKAKVLWFSRVGLTTPLDADIAISESPAVLEALVAGPLILHG